MDTNVLLYLLSSDPKKADKAEEIVSAGPWISVQVLNELANVMRRKLKMSWTEIKEFLLSIRSICRTEILTPETHDTGLDMAQRYGLSVYDAMITAAALNSGCEILYSEDMQNGLLIDRQLRIHNPLV